uniref:Uncharacterized protein n=1 Tax=Coturnix japonica TaxID=93934 RepID=A0A8C2U9Y8_COTJA
EDARGRPRSRSRESLPSAAAHVTPGTVRSAAPMAPDEAQGVTPGGDRGQEPPARGPQVPGAAAAPLQRAAAGSTPAPSPPGKGGGTQPTAAAGAPTATSCSLRGGLLHNGFHPAGPTLSNGGCGEAPHPLLLRPEPPPLGHGSPAKKCRLRRRMDSGRRHRPRNWLVCCGQHYCKSQLYCQGCVFPAGMGNIYRSSQCHWAGHCQVLCSQ